MDEDHEMDFEAVVDALAVEDAWTAVAVVASVAFATFVQAVVVAAPVVAVE